MRREYVSTIEREGAREKRVSTLVRLRESRLVRERESEKRVR